MKNIVIIGAGASGLMAAVTAAEMGNKVTILEHKETLGKKLKMTGNGKCNITNLDTKLYNFNSSDKRFVKTALSCFGVKETLRYFENMGMAFTTKGDYVYPRSESALSVVEFFQEKCKISGINIIYKAEVKKITGSDNDFKVQYIRDNERTEINADKVIIAAGGKSMPKTGSDGSGYYFAKSLGHNIITPVPGLVGLKVKEDNIKKLAGLRATGAISVYTDNWICCQQWGEIQFTNYGVSGIPVFQMAGCVARELLVKKEIKGYLNMCLEKGFVRMKDYIDAKKAAMPDYPAKMLFKTFFDNKFIEVMFEDIQIDPDMPIGKLSEGTIEKMANYTDRLPITFYDTNGFDNAQISSGGVDTEEVNPFTMESKLVKGVHFAGEVLDVDGQCGGFNLQWAWTSGRLAGLAVSE